MKEVFKYGYKEIDYLKNKDKKLAAVIDRIGIIEREVIPDLFAALVHSVVGQQISSRAAVSVWKKMNERLGSINPETIMAASAEDIQSCGISMRKALYIKGIREAVRQERLNIEEFPKLSDEEIINRLSALKGIGVWTAEMLLIFSLQRPDVVSRGDLGIQRGMKILYGHKDLDKARFERYRKRYSPYGSVASLYLWELAGGR